MNALLRNLDMHFAAQKEKIALRDDPLQPGITYGQFDELSGRIYAFLKSRGIGREDTVMLCLPRGIQFPIAMVGVWKAGAAFVVCEDTYAPERIEYIKKDCGCKLVISDENWAEIMQTEYLPGRETVDPHDLAYAVYTSGTTGNPKGVLHEFGNLVESCEFKNLDGERLVRNSDILALNAPLNFVAAQDYINNVFYSGATLFLVAYTYVKNPAALIELYDTAGVTCTFMTPSSFRLLQDMNPQMRWIVLGGEPCANLYRDGIVLLNGYNMSEAGCDLCLFVIDKPYDITPIGQNRGGRTIRLLDENGNDIKDGEDGELCYENPFVRGYKNLPDKTAAAWRGGLFHTGDIAARNEDGNLVLKGRNDDMIKINGNRIEPGEIEAACKKILGISWACAKGFSDEKQSFIVLYYLEDIRVDPAFMRDELSKTLPYYMIPSYYVRIGEIPMLPNGKINKKALLPPDKNTYRAAYAAPENEEQEKICAVFSRILEMDRIGIDDDFYELGGDSLRSLEAGMELESIGVSVSMLYKNRTARKIWQALSETRGNEKDDSGRNRKALEHDQPLSFFQLYMFDYQLFAPTSIMWNMPRCWKYSKKDVDVKRLAAAYEKVLAAHPVFRTVLRYDEDFQLVQHYDETISVKVPIKRVGEEEAASAAQLMVQPFRLLNEPMYRACLFETEENVFLFIDMHHIISDGVSLQVFTDHLTRAYEGEDLPEDCYYLVMRDYVKNLSAEYAEYKKYFDDLYGDKKWVRGLTPDMDTGEASFDNVVTPLDIAPEDLESYLKTAGLSRNAFLQTVSLLSVAFMEKAENVMLGWVYHSRDDRRKESAIGLLIKEIPLGLALGSLPDVRSVYDSVKDQMNKGMIYQDYPYLTCDSSIARDDAFCFIDEGDILNLKGPGSFPSEEIPLASTNAVGWLMALAFFNLDGKIFMNMNYTPTRYHRETMEKYCEVYKKLAAKLMASSPETSMKEILE